MRFVLFVMLLILGLFVFFLVAVFVLADIFVFFPATFSFQVTKKYILYSITEINFHISLKYNFLILS